MDRFYEQSILVPANTPIAAPVTQAWPLEETTLRKITITIPDGHNGLTGVRVLWAGQQIIPWANNSYIIANNRVIDVAFDDYITATGLVIGGFNTDVFPHTFYLEATVTDKPAHAQLAQQASPGTAVLPPSSAQTPDPLSPASLLASLPPDIAALITAGQEV